MSFSKVLFAALFSVSLAAGAAETAHKDTGLEGHCSGGVVNREFEVGKDGKLHLLDAEGKPLVMAAENCCSLYKD